MILSLHHLEIRLELDVYLKMKIAYLCNHWLSIISLASHLFSAQSNALIKSPIHLPQDSTTNNTGSLSSFTIVYHKKYLIRSINYGNLVDIKSEHN